jgi:nicotinamide-nucleotide adenylyltransferase
VARHGKKGKDMDEIGVIHGRFQVLHNDHLRYLLAGKQRCRHLVVGITNPDPKMTRDDAADPGRSLLVNNPLTYFERYTLLRGALKEAGLAPDDFSIVPFPINIPALYRYYVPLSATFYLTIYDDWGRRKLDQFKSQGLKTAVLWERSIEDKGISAQDVRKGIAMGKSWERLVPGSAAAMLKKWSIPERIKDLYDAHSSEETTS